MSLVMLLNPVEASKDLFLDLKFPLFHAFYLSFFYQVVYVCYLKI
jgi:hypothetical protein